MDCIISFNDKFVSDKRYSSLFHLNIEKSDSTNAILANIIAISSQKSRKTENLPSTIVQSVLNIVLWSHFFSWDWSKWSRWYISRSSRWSHSIWAIWSSVYVNRNWERCRVSILIPNSPVRSLTNSWDNTRDISSEERFSLSLSAWMIMISSTIDRMRFLIISMIQSCLISFKLS